MRGASPRLCDILVARTGGLAPADVHALAQEKTWSLLERAARLTDERSALSARVTDLLHPVVPTLADRELRRAAVRLRRDIHNARRTPRTGADLMTLLPVLDEPARAACEHWSRLTEELEDLKREAAGTLTAELDASWHEMTRLLDGGPMRAALALASPGFLSARPARSAAPQHRAARTVTSYVTRAALKTSPFSHFTTIAPLVLGETAALPEPGRITSGTTPLAVELLLAMARVPELARRLTLRANPSLRRQADGTVVALLPFHSCADGFFCGDDETQILSGLATRVLPHRDAEPAGTGAWARRLDVPAPAVTRLVRTGILQSVTPWAPDSAAPLTELAASLTDAETGTGPADADEVSRARAFRAAVRDAADQERAAAHMDPTVRSTAVSRLRDAGTRALRAAGAVEPDWLASAPLVHETVGDGGTDAVAGAAVREDLERLRDLLAGNVVRSRFYDQLVAAFVAEYGPGGYEPDLLTFLLKVVRHPALFGVLSEAVRDDRVRTDTVAPDGFGTLAPATATALFQVAAATPEDVRAGRHLTVVNRISTGPGALLTRWLAVPGVHEAAGEGLAAWLRRLTPGAEPLQTAAWHDWAPVQYLDTRLAAHLEWPTTLPARGGRGVLLGHLALRHDPASGTLQALRRADGRTVSFPYLGSVPRHLVGGAHRVLMALTDPWVVRVRANGEHHTGDPQPAPARGVVVTERLTHGRLVLRRRTWRLPSSMLPVHERGEPHLAHLDRLREWAARHGMPRRFYLRQAAHLGLSPAKPAWVDLANLYTVHAALRSLAPEATEAELVEAVPDIDGYPSPGGGGGRAVELTAALALGEAG